MTANNHVVTRTQAEKWRVKNGLPVAMPVSINTMRRRKLEATVAESAAAEAAAARHRATDPVECAKRILMQRGHRVWSSAIDGGPPGTWFVSGKGRLDGDAVIAFAATKTGGGDRVAATRAEEAMGVVDKAEANRIKARGTTKARVLDDLAQARAAAGTLAILSTRVGLDRSTLGNFQSGFSPISERLLAGLYGDIGCVLRRELLDTPPAASAPVPLERAAVEAAKVDDASAKPEDEDQTAGVADDIAQPDAPTDKVFEDVGDALARQAAAKDALFDAVGALRDDAAQVGNVAVRFRPADDADAADEAVADPAVADTMLHAAAPLASVVSHLDKVRLRIIEAAARARGEIAARLAAIDAKTKADLAALDRAAAILAEVG